MPKILIITVDAWNTTLSASSSSTFAMLFSQYPVADVANIYIREEMPNSSVCGHYFQISEQRVIQSLLKRTAKTGKQVFAENEISQQDIVALQNARNLYRKNQKKRSYLKLMARELIWKLGKWKSPELDAFIDEFAPDVIVFSMEGYIHLNRICRYAIRRSKAKAIGYFWDDNFTYKQLKNNWGYYCLRFFQRNSLKKLARQCNAFWAISPKTKKEADQFFGINSILLTKPIFFAEEEKWRETIPSMPIKMLYTGNLAIGRAETIIAVSEALDNINTDYTRVTLDVYTPTDLAEDEQKRIGQHVTFHSPVLETEVHVLQKSADVLLFVEALDGPLSKKARLSFSTKITDYLHTGKCIIALGDGDTAPMAYFADTNAALCATRKSDIEKTIRTIIDDPAVINQYGLRAYECARMNHNGEKVIACVKNTIEAILE